MKQFAFIVDGSQREVNEALRLIFASGVEVRAMNSYGGGLMGGGIITYFVCYGIVDSFKEKAKNYIPRYQRKYELPTIEKDYKEGRLKESSYQKKLSEMRIFKYSEIIEHEED